MSVLQAVGTLASVPPSKHKGAPHFPARERLEKLALQRQRSDHTELLSCGCEAPPEAHEGEARRFGGGVAGCEPLDSSVPQPALALPEWKLQTQGQRLQERGHWREPLGFTFCPAEGTLSAPGARPQLLSSPMPFCMMPCLTSARATELPVYGLRPLKP